jgi:hypothetical protein
MNRIVMRTERTSLHQAEDGHFFLTSPRGNYYQVDPTKPELFQVCAIWLGLTVDGLCKVIDGQRKE